MASLVQISTPGERPTGEINESTSVAEVLKRCPTARRIFDRYGLKGCGAEHGPTEPLSFFAAAHQVDLQALLRDLRAEVENPSSEQYVYRETLADYIYRRFFKAGIAITLTVGALWGAINLLQIALDKNLLQLRLVPSIHAHAHAMIFGWVGLFVMGFAYQSFPRFKFTTLWRPGPRKPHLDHDARRDRSPNRRRVAAAGGSRFGTRRFISRGGVRCNQPVCADHCPDSASVHGTPQPI